MEPVLRETSFFAIVFRTTDGLSAIWKWQAALGFPKSIPKRACEASFLSGGGRRFRSAVGSVCGTVVSVQSSIDQWHELFRMQKSLNERIGVKTDGMTDEAKTQWVLNYCRAMTQEIAELTDSVPWKWWAKYQKFDEQNARVEVVDLFHFLISLAQVLGMSAEDVFQAYLKKNEVNLKRQDSGYSTKDHSDSKHI